MLFKRVRRLLFDIMGVCIAAIIIQVLFNVADLNKLISISILFFGYILWLIYFYKPDMSKFTMSSLFLWSILSGILISLTYYFVNIHTLQLVIFLTIASLIINRGTK